MSLIRKIELSWWQSLCVKLLMAGKLPEHVAIIMDGNRRYARAKHVKTSVGHEKGYDKFKDIFAWIKIFGINELTMYSFSIDNFKRTQEEVDDILSLIHFAVGKMIEFKQELIDDNLGIRFIGNISLLPLHIQEVMYEASQLFDKEANYEIKRYVNICVAYTSHEEITSSIKEIGIAVENNLITSIDINEYLLEKCLYTSKCAPIDLIIRTSGESRLSDFLLWQTSYSVLLFIDVLWPSMSFWDCAYCMFNYQNQFKILKSYKEKSIFKEEKRKTEQFREIVKKENDTYKQINNNIIGSDEKELLMTMKDHDERVSKFLQKLEIKRNTILLNNIKKNIAK